MWGKQWYLGMDVKASSAPSGDRGAVVFEDSSGNEWGGVYSKNGPKWKFKGRFH